MLIHDEWEKDSEGQGALTIGLFHRVCSPYQISFVCYARTSFIYHPWRLPVLGIM
jgi:hypothetical protein